MRSMILAVALAAGAGGSAMAQAHAVPGGGRAPGAELFLAHTGELALTDAQVTRLAAIARRSAARRQTMRASMDSIRDRFGPDNRPDSAARRQLAQRLRADADRMREQEHADRRDAIAVLTADQQARAWEMAANRGRAGRGDRGMRDRGMRDMGMRRQSAVPRRPPVE